MVGEDNCEFPSSASFLTNRVWHGAVLQGAQEEFGLREALCVSIRSFIRRFRQTTNRKTQTVTNETSKKLKKIQQHISTSTQMRNILHQTLYQTSHYMSKHPATLYPDNLVSDRPSFSGHNHSWTATILVCNRS